MPKPIDLLNVFRIKSHYPKKKKIITAIGFWMLLLSSPLINGCTLLGPKIDPPDVVFYKPIPFPDGEEAVEVHSKFPEKNRIVYTKEWDEILSKNKHLIFPNSSWSTIKIFILDTCNKFQASCKQQVDSLDDVFKNLDKIIEKILGGK